MRYNTVICNVSINLFLIGIETGPRVGVVGLPNFLLLTPLSQSFNNHVYCALIDILYTAVRIGLEWRMNKIKKK